MVLSPSETVVVVVDIVDLSNVEAVVVEGEEDGEDEEVVA